MHPLQRHRDWIRFGLPVLVLAGLAAGFLVLEQRRNERLLSDSIRLTESLDGELFSVTFLEPTVTDRQLEYIHRYPKLRRLLFSGTDSLEGRLDQLRNLPNLVTIDMSNVHWLDEAVMSHVAGLPRLRNLALSASNITDPALAQLACHPELSFVSLRGCDRISDHSIDTLVSLPALKQIDLVGTEISLEGFSRLRAARKDLTIRYSPSSEATGVTFSEMPGGGGSWVGVTFTEIPAGGGRPGGITSSGSTADLTAVLSIPHNWWTGAWDSGDSLKSVRTISLSGPAAVESMAWLAPRLSQLDSITIPAAGLAELTASQVAEVRRADLAEITSADHLAHLANMPLLLNLSLEVTAPLAADALPADCELPQLTHLDLNGPGVNDAVVQFLTRVAAPTRVEFEVASPLSSDTLQALGGWRHVEFITVRGGGVNAALIEAMSKLSDASVHIEISVPPDVTSLPGLEEPLQFSYLGLQAPGVNDDVIQFLSRTTAPTHLDLATNTPPSAEVLQDLGGWRQVRYITLRGAGVNDELIAALSQISALQSLDLEAKSPLQPDALQPLSGLSQLTAITLRGPGVSDPLVASLAQWHSLSSLTVMQAPVSDAAFAPFVSASTSPEIRSYETHVSPQMLRRLRETNTRR